MLASEITLGAILWAYVSGRKRAVRVVGLGRGRGQRYALRLAKSGRTLDARRSAQSLHVCAHIAWPGLSEKQDTLADACAKCRALHTASVEHAEQLQRMGKPIGLADSFAYLSRGGELARQDWASEVERANEILSGN